MLLENHHTNIYVYKNIFKAQKEVDFSLIIIYNIITGLNQSI